MKNASFLQVEDNPAVERLSVDLYNMFQALSRAFPWGLPNNASRESTGMVPNPAYQPPAGTATLWRMRRIPQQNMLGRAANCWAVPR